MELLKTREKPEILILLELLDKRMTLASTEAALVYSFKRL